MLLWEKRKQRVLVPCWESNNFPQKERRCLVGPFIVNFNSHKKANNIKMIALPPDRRLNIITAIL